MNGGSGHPGAGGADPADLAGTSPSAPTPSSAPSSAPVPALSSASGKRGGLRIRTRLMLMYGAVFLLCGTALLLTQYLLVDRLLVDNGTTVTAPFEATTVPDQAPDSAQPSYPLQPAQPAPAAGAALATTQVVARFTTFKDAVLDAVAVRSLIMLGLLTLIAAAAGWWMAGRSLSRLHTVTATARKISERNLHDRLALVGPQDEIKELGDTFDAMLARLDRAFAANRRFAANASHELRTPLALQRASLEIPLTEGRVPDDLRPSIERSLRATARSERLVGSLLLLAKGQQGPERYAEADLAELAAEAVDTYRAQAAAGGIVLTTDLSRAPTAGDPVLLEQVAANLVQNAVRHNRPGADGRGHIQVTTGRASHGVELRVLNSGPDVESTDVDALFEPFHRGAEARLSGTGAGAGLGLSIVRAVVDSHGGTIRAEARPEGGLIVSVMLPAA